MPRSGPFDVSLTDEKRRDLTTLLVEAIRTGLQARSAVMDDNGLIDYAYALYEQERQSGIPLGRPTPSADLTSPIGMENVDSLSARAVKTIMVEPLWIVEGIGASAKKAPAVEEYMQMRQEKMRLQKTFKRWFDAAFIEEGAILEVCEDAEPFRCVEVTNAAITRNLEDTDQDPRGSVVVDDEKGDPVPQRDATGQLVPAADGEEYVEVRREYTDYRRRGASLRLHSGKDALMLPGHARDENEIYAQAFRFWRRVDQLKEDVENDLYEKDAVASLGDSQERDTRAEHTRQHQDVEVDHSSTMVDKELWRVQVLANLDGKGFAFYIVTLSVQHDVILRVKRDWLKQWRGVYANPNPRTYSAWGYSMILTKLGTTIEEHTAWRNMNANRGTLKANTPLKVLHTESWDPELQPFGLDQVIRVNSMEGIQPFEFDDIPQGAFDRERTCVIDAQRIIGLNDIALGQLSRTDRTLGENKLASRESYSRTDAPIGLLQEAVEEVGALIHAIEEKTLREMEHGLEAPAPVAEKLQLRGGDYKDFDGTFTADMIGGSFRFKPRGSVESADPERRQAVMIGGFDLLLKWAGINPFLRDRLMSAEFAMALLQWWVTEFKPRDKQAFLAPIQQPTMQPGMPGAPGAPGAPVTAGPGGNVLSFPGGGGPSFGGENLIAQLTSQLPPSGGQ